MSKFIQSLTKYDLDSKYKLDADTFLVSLWWPWVKWPPWAKLKPKSFFPGPKSAVYTQKLAGDPERA